MSNPKGFSLESMQTELAARLGEVDEQFRSEMRARGFDPAQDESLALTGRLARLYTERENLREELEKLTGSETSADEWGRS
jgi:hypothetical protein